MGTTSVQTSFRGLARLKLFLALSRTPHGLIDMTTPAFGALLWLGAFPPWEVMSLGMATAFAGYTAVYALNDVVDYRTDKEKLRHGELDQPEDAQDLDAMLVRHPMARGLLSFWEGLGWALAWAALALVGAWMLNPVCVLIFLGGSALEAVYCLMWRLTPLRTLVSGAVKTSGAVAGVFAVDPSPSPLYLALLFFCLFFWEVGGQNVPNDWADLEDDRRFGARTIPVRLGLDASARIILGSLAMSVCLVGVLFFLSPAAMGLPSAVAGMLVSGWLLLLPAFRLYQGREASLAMSLFNRASYFPLAMLILIAVHLF